MAAGVLFFGGLFGIAAFAALRSLEVKRGTRIFARSRNHLDQWVTRTYRAAVLGDIPTGWRVWLSHTLHTLGHIAARRIATSLRLIERWFSNQSRRMIDRRPPLESGKTPSRYLKDITPEQGKSDKESF